ncbi:MAG: hypothetical protein IJ121_11785 [Eubacterium sp.]|nr:hypothetical protein [Eubacterium sp.]
MDHTHDIVREHSHHHEQEHTHDHTHSHAHDHAHGHDHTDLSGSAEGKDKTLILLKYTVDHNTHHVDELESLITLMRAAGRDEAAALTEQAQDAFRRGSELLREALAAYSH